MVYGALPDDLPGIPLLLREARGAFTQAIRVALDSAGLPALPRNGPFIISGLHGGVAPVQLIGQRRKSLESFQTMEKLRESGYVSGSDENLALTERGHEAAHVVYGAIEQLAASMNEHLGEEGMTSFVKGLLFLIEAKELSEERY